MRAELVMIGTELLLGEVVDTNASFLADGLSHIGVDVYYKSTVGDNYLRIIEVLSNALSRADVVITSGGLGPTMDDVTRECVAALLNKPLKLDNKALASIENYFHKLDRQMSENNRKQAYLLEDSIIVPNDWGTAPGFIVEAFGKTVISLPGVPRELKGMFNNTVLPYLSSFSEGVKLISRTLHFAGIGESKLEEIVGDILKKQSNPTIAPYASLGMVKLRITAKAPNEKEAFKLIEPIEKKIRKLAGKWLYGVDGQTLEEIVGQMLATKNESLAIAESCSGGLIAHRVTNVPGSSQYFERGFITYSNQAKMELLGVPKITLDSYGAVSEQTASAMAEGVRQAANVDWGLAVTGIAGPGGATANKPVGLVYISVANEDNTITEVHRFQGSREDIKFKVSQVALNLLRTNL